MFVDMKYPKYTIRLSTELHGACVEAGPGRVREVLGEGLGVVDKKKEVGGGVKVVDKVKKKRAKKLSTRKKVVDIVDKVAPPDEVFVDKAGVDGVPFVDNTLMAAFDNLDRVLNGEEVVVDNSEVVDVEPPMSAFTGTEEVAYRPRWEIDLEKKLAKQEAGRLERVRRGNEILGKGNAEGL